MFLIVISGAVVVSIILLMAALRARSCPDCHEPLPHFRMPRSWRQAFRGGWTCPHCQVELDREGQKVSV